MFSAPNAAIAIANTRRPCSTIHFIIVFSIQTEGINALSYEVSLLVYYAGDRSSAVVSHPFARKKAKKMGHGGFVAPPASPAIGQETPLTVARKSG
jgi:hypothetical protein